MNKQQNNHSIGRILGRTFAAAAIGAIAMTSISAQAAESVDSLTVAQAALSASKLNEHSEPAAGVRFNFKLGGIANTGLTDYGYEGQRQFERSSAFDQARVNPYDSGDDRTFGSLFDYELPIYSSNNSSTLGSYNSLNR